MRPELLLVDDEVTFVEILGRALDRRGFAVRLAHDGDSAMSAAAQRLPSHAVVDLRLPDMSGLKLVQWLLQRSPDMRVLVLTGYGSIATAIEAVKLGAIYYLTKPIHADQVVEAFGHVTADPDVPLPPRPLSVDRIAWEHIQRVLAQNGGNISAAAREMNMHRRTLQRKLGKHAPKA